MMTDLMNLLRWTGAALNALAALLLYLMIALQAGRPVDRPAAEPVAPVLPFAPGGDVLAIL